MKPFIALLILCTSFGSGVVVGVKHSHNILHNIDKGVSIEWDK